MGACDLSCVLVARKVQQEVPPVWVASAVIQTSWSERKVPLKSQPFVAVDGVGSVFPLLLFARHKRVCRLTTLERDASNH